jgi:2,3-bisphosphoglycerate-dependent phosphoglycerate mutase
MQLLFVRHGESEANILREISTRGWKHPLTPLGREQADRLVTTLAGYPIDRIYSSPVMRALQTAGILAEARGLTFEITEALREYDLGVLEGRSDVDAWNQYKMELQEWIEKGHLDFRMEGGESFEDIRQRFEPFVKGIIKENQTDQNSTPVLVSHGGLFRLMLPLIFMNVDPKEALTYPMHNTGVIAAQYRDGNLYCTEWCGLKIA